MGSTTVRIQSDRKAQLERLQIQWQKRYGHLPTQQELLGEVLDYVTTHAESFFEVAGWRAPTASEIDAMFRQVVRPGLGDPDRSITEEMDEILYGDEAYERKMGRR